ncbi:MULTISPECIES: LysM peptidoglycan-binding domain-containing protein [Marinobacter]|uniref:LysM peptidoglycan-binding domain-containing protein n=1 Tax=Marinobacter TaxID=2742 RepID=UPI001B2504FC|nr:LysM peptidoglycan-binding domain-containing protein [Marinobacter sp.]MBO6812596.1 LysM peptidoglycan-binding domain-containing protein [Marinobacter sp.]MBO6873968.1 LysM peptidoglycan-binding domain-containing protein [Marinobacter sp.]
MPQHEVQSGETLSAIASKYQVSLDAIKSENPIIKDVNHIEAGWNLTVPENSADRGVLPAAQSANDDTKDDLECSQCSIECEALVHVTGEEDTVYALSRTQLQDLYREIETLNKPLAELKRAEAGPEEDIPAAREKAWGSLRKLGALPETEQSSTAKELLNDYEARWKRERQRLEHQRRREKRIEYEINQIRSQILLPASQANLTERKDLLSVRVFTTLCAELEATLPGVKAKVEAHELITEASKQDLDEMDERLRFLRAALEAELQYRMVQNDQDADSHQVQRLKHETQELKKYTRWPDFIAEADLQSLVDKKKRLNELDDELIPYMDYVNEYAARVSWVVRLWNVIHHEEVEKHRNEQQERRDLIVDIEKTLRRLVETSPPSAVDVLAKPNTGSMKSRPLVELKHTGGAGYRYARQEVLNQLRGNWKALKTSDVRAVMSASDFERAWDEAKNGLKNDRSLKVKFAEWKSKEDNFFNQLEIELLKKEASTEDGRFAASAEAQMFRFAAQCSLESRYDPQKGEVYVGTQMQSAYSLLQGEATFAARIPDETGAKIVLEYENHEGDPIRVHCGYFRADAEYRIQGFAGACLSLASNAKLSSAPGNVGISGEANGEAFAGATVSNEARFGIKWKAVYRGVDEATDDLTRGDSEFELLAEVKPEIAVSSGIGLGFDYKIELVEGRLVAYFKGSLVLGPGGSGGIAAELNAGQVWELIKFIRWSLEQSDFRFLDWISEEAFDSLSRLLSIFACSEEAFSALVAKGADTLLELWRSLYRADEEVRKVAEGVLKNNRLRLLTPSAKAQLLTIMVRDSGPILGRGDPHRDIATKAMIEVFETIRSHRELIEVLKRIGNDSGKGSLQDLMSNYYKLFPRRLFQSTQSERVENWLSSVV